MVVKAYINCTPIFICCLCRLPNGGLLEIAKVYPLDAVFDTLEDVPEEVSGFVHAFQVLFLSFKWASVCNVFSKVEILSSWYFWNSSSLLCLGLVCFWLPMHGTHISAISTHIFWCLIFQIKNNKRYAGSSKWTVQVLHILKLFLVQSHQLVYGSKWVLCEKLTWIELVLNMLLDYIGSCRSC